MATAVLLYPAYGTVSCHQVARYAAGIEDLRLVLADNDPTSSDEDIFDEVLELPPPEQLPQAYDLLRRWFAGLKPDGVFMQSERGLLLGSIMAREFGLKGPSIEAAHLCSNKYRQRVTLGQAGIGNPSFALAENAADVRRLARDYGFPLVLKCVISTMSRLVTLVCGEDDIEGAVAKVREGISRSLDVARLLGFARTAKVDLGCDPARQFLVESFLRGDFVETDGLATDGPPFSFGVTEQVQTVDPPFFIQGYLLPADCVESAPIEAVSDRALDAIGLHYSGFSTEMRVSDGQVRIVEVNGRLGWDEAFGELFRVRTHRERILQTIQLALGIEPELMRDATRSAALAYRCCFYNGIVEDLPARGDLLKLEHDGLRLGLATHKGARFVAPPDPEAYPHVAWALATHPNSSRAAYEIARQAVDSLDVFIRAVGGNNVLE